MSTRDKVLQHLAQSAITGRGAHVETREVFVGVDWKSAGRRPRGSSHSLHQLLKHMSFWQEWVIEWLDGKKPPIPVHASGSWPGGVRPSRVQEWEEAVTTFREGLAELERRSQGAALLSGYGEKTRLEMLQTIGAHNSYHAGQAVLLRQQLGKWPPPSGGLTW